MRNPLNKRIPRELKHDFGKYFVIFMFMILLISLVSGFLVADNSVTHSYNEGFSKYNLEDGHLSFNEELPYSLRNHLETLGDLKIYKLEYFEEDLNSGATLRIYQKRNEVDRECLMSGEMPEKDNEIALDRMFAQNADINIGDTIELNTKKLKVTGLIALVDYSSLFENSSDMMFDSINFGVGILTPSGFENFNSQHITYNYAWKYSENIDREDKATAKKRSDDFVDLLEDEIKSYDKEVANKAIDKGKMIFLYEFFQTLKKEGTDLSSYNNVIGRSLLLSQINQTLKEENIDLNKEFDVSDLKELDIEDITINGNDIKNALNANQEDIDAAQDYIDHIEDYFVEVEDYLPRYLNQAINFTGDDMGSDKAMFILFDYLVVLIIAFIFAVTISNTISQEAAVIGTLRASGFTKIELMAHYMVLPVLVTFIAAIIGNVLGYTVMEDMFVSVYYNSYSLATYETLLNWEAFIDTTLIPIVLMFVINLFVLNQKLRLSPLKFLRRDLSKKKQKRAFPLNSKLRVMTRYRIRILFQNIPNYLTMAFGIFIGGAVVVFGFMFGPLLDDYAQLSIDTRICDYQYVLKEEVETDNQQAEKFAMTSLKTTNENYMEDEISIYGIEEDSQYIKEDIPKGKVIVSNGFADKFKLQKGDSFILKDAYNNQKYKFKVAGIYEYDGAMTVFMPIEDYRDTFDEDSDYFTGYFSNEKLEDINNDDILTIVDVTQLTKMSDQLKVSMGSFMELFKYFGAVMFLLLMYILSKQIIEKNAQSISMCKILGFNDKEISSLYILSTSIVVILSLLLSIPLINAALKWAFSYYLYTEMTGYIPYIVSNNCFIYMFIIGICCYGCISILQFIKINKIPKSDALKNVE